MIPIGVLADETGSSSGSNGGAVVVVVVVIIVVVAALVLWLMLRRGSIADRAEIDVPIDGRADGEDDAGAAPS